MLFVNEKHIITRCIVIAIEPASGGFKGLPGKNLALLGGVMLLTRTIRCALIFRLVDRVVVTTDEPDIVQAAVTNGVKAPFMRSSELSKDDTTSDAVVPFY
jgi:CMP-N,N'-diacetyllegionaminic acid synthase